MVTLIMKIFRNDSGDWRPVCSDSWNSSWSEACRQLGTSGDSETTTVSTVDEEFWYGDETMQLGKHPIQLFSEKRGNIKICQSKAEVGVECKNFGKLSEIIG